MAPRKTMASFAEWVRARDANAPSSGPPAALRVAARLSEFEVDGATETSTQFNWLVDTLVREEAERASVRRFKFEADQKRALLARLLARYCCRAVVGADCTIARTDGGKPHAYPVPAAAAAAAPNFNFNVEPFVHFKHFFNSIVNPRQPSSPRPSPGSSAAP